MDEKGLIRGNQPEMKLQIDTIKRVFSALEEDEKVVLIRDLMKEAKIDSVIHNNRPTCFSGLYLPAPPTYRDNFIKFISPFLCSFLIVVEDQYIDQCFEIYKILQERSVGSQYESQCEMGDQFLYTEIENLNNINWLSIDQTEFFKNEASKNQIFTERIFNNADIELVQIICFRFDNIQINIKLTDLFVLLSNNYDHAYIVLMLFGYLSNKEEKQKEKEETYNKYENMLLKLFPEHSTIEEIITNQKVKLSNIFDIKFI